MFYLLSTAQTEKMWRYEWNSISAMMTVTTIIYHATQYIYHPQFYPPLAHHSPYRIIPSINLQQRAQLQQHRASHSCKVWYFKIPFNLIVSRAQRSATPSYTEPFLTETVRWAKTYTSRIYNMRVSHPLRAAASTARQMPERPQGRRTSRKLGRPSSGTHSPH